MGGWGVWHKSSRLHLEVFFPTRMGNRPITHLILTWWLHPHHAGRAIRCTSDDTESLLFHQWDILTKQWEQNCALAITIDPKTPQRQSCLEHIESCFQMVFWHWPASSYNNALTQGNSTTSWNLSSLSYEYDHTATFTSSFSPYRAQYPSLP